MLHWVVCELVHILKKSFGLCHKSYSLGESLIEKTKTHQITLAKTKLGGCMKLCAKFVHIFLKSFGLCHKIHS
jgi:hypothetical protein